MQTRLAPLSGRSRRQRAFSLLEILLVVSIMTVIVYALYTMFDHTQRALRGNSTQVDVQEAARATMDLISRDVEQCAASGLYENNSLGTNVFTLVSFPIKKASDALTQELSFASAPRWRTNVLMDLFLLTRPGNYWTSIGYFVASPTNPAVAVAGDGIGSLYRFSPTNPPAMRLSVAAISNWVNQFTNQYYYCRTNAGPVADGIVHLRLQAYDPLGYLMFYDYPRFYGYNRVYAGYNVTNLLGSDRDLLRLTWPRNVVQRNVILRMDQLRDNSSLYQTEFCFLNNALPAYIELELGVLEPQAWDKVKALPTPELKRQYLLKHAGQVHLFRKRIPIHLAPNEP